MLEQLEERKPRALGGEVEATSVISCDIKARVEWQGGDESWISQRSEVASAKAMRSQ